MIKPLLSVLGAVLFSGSAWAGLTGQSVTGAYIIQGLTTNWFDPSDPAAKMFVPQGCLNSAGTTVTIGAATEFCQAFGESTLTAEFTDTQLTLTGYFGTAPGYSPYEVTFAFAPGVVSAVSEVSDSFPSGLSFSYANDTLTLNWGGASGLRHQQTFAGVYNFETTTAPVPEPYGVLLGIAGLALVAIPRRRTCRARLA